MNTTYQLTRHLHLSSFESQLGLYNLAQRTELLVTDADWRKIGFFASSPQSLEGAGDGQSGVIVAAIENKILVSGPESVDLAGPTSALRFELEHMICTHTGLKPAELRSLYAEHREGKFVAALELARNLFHTFNGIHWKRATHLFQEWYAAYAMRYLIALFDHNISFYKQMRPEAQEPYRLDAELCYDAAQRQQADTSWHQQPCMPVCSTRRAELVVKDFPRGAKILVLGDDDLVSLAFPAEKKYEIDVVEVDDRLVDIIRSGIARRGLQNVNVHTVDLEGGMPEHLQGKYDAVLTDPPYSTKGMTGFIECCHAAIRKEGRGFRKLYLSTNPELIEDQEMFVHDFTEKQFLLLRRHRDFNQYPCDVPPYKEQLKFFMSRIDYRSERLFDLFVCPYYYSDLFEAVYLSEEPATSAFRR